MPSFDFSSKVDLQTLDNAINVVSKEITNRFDFKGSHVLIELSKKDFKLSLEAESEMKLNQIIDVLISRSMKQGLAAEIYDFSKEAYVSGTKLPINAAKSKGGAVTMAVSGTYDFGNEAPNKYCVEPLADGLLQE